MTFIPKLRTFGSQTLSHLSRSFHNKEQTRVVSLASKSVQVEGLKYRVTYDKDRLIPNGYWICQTCKQVLDYHRTTTSDCTFECQMIYAIGPNEDENSPHFKKGDVTRIKQIAQGISWKDD